MRKKQKCRFIYTEMCLVWDGTGRSVLCLGGPCWVRGGPGQSVAHPGWSGVIRIDTVLGPGVIGSDVPWLECPACNALTWVITVTE